MKIQREKLQPPGQSSFHASQEPEAEVETTFDIQDEVLGDSQIEKLVRLNSCQYRLVFEMLPLMQSPC